MRPNLSKPPKVIRSAPIFFSDAGGEISDDGSTITGLSIMRPGVEARGHGYWIDETTCSQVLEDCVATGDGGVKAHVGHGGLSDDGINRHVGQFSNFRDDNGVPRADLNLEGINPDLENKVRYYADKGKRQAGLSIAAGVPDRPAMAAFMLKHKDGKGQFKSPDPSNKKNLPHLRLPKGGLTSIDIVGRPAANPEGMFGDLEEALFEARDVLLYALKQTDDVPVEFSQVGVDPDRFRGFVQRILEDEKLEIRPIEAADQEDPMSKDAKDPKETETETPGGDKSVSLAQLTALQTQLSELAAKQTQLEAENTQLKEQNTSTAARLAAQQLATRQAEAIAFAKDKLWHMPGGFSLEEKAAMVVALDALPEEMGKSILKAFEASSVAIKAHPTSEEQGNHRERPLGSTNLAAVNAELANAISDLKKNPGKEALSDDQAMNVVFDQQPELYHRWDAAQTLPAAA